MDTEVLGLELARALSTPPESGWADVALAGSGEPTFAANVASAFAAITATLDRAKFDRPRRIYTNGLHLAQPDVESALARWLDTAYGQVWVKLDALEDRTIEAVWQVRISARAHFLKLWDFARRHPVGLQSTLVRARGLPSIEDTARRMAMELGQALDSGARIVAIHLLSPSRKPGNAAAASDIVPATLGELEAAASILRAATPIPVTTYA